jgi:mannose-6-phosphate isomerase-like protein (cupin superfamily)
MESIKGVDLPSLALDKDGTVCETLRHIHDNYYDIKSGRDTMIFANGGDRTDDNIPEKKVCEELGIEMIFGVGGGKINNSSSIIQDGFERYTKTHSEERPWGFWKIINQGPGFKVKMLVVDPGKSLSVQRHKHRSEHWIVVGGRATVHLDEMVADLVEGESWYIPKKEWHQLVNNTTEILNVVEVSTGDYLKEDDIERKESWNVKE